MPSQYKTIAGVQYERDLVEAAEKAPKPIDMHTAAELWFSALDGNKVTEIESRTLERIANGDHGAVTADAKAWIQKKRQRWATRDALEKAKPGGPAKGRKKLENHPGTFDAGLLEHADDCNKSGKSISFDDAEDLIDSAMDGGKITQTEKTTLDHIVKHYKCEDRAKVLLSIAVSAFLDMNKYAQVLSGDEAPVPSTDPVPAGPAASSADAEWATVLVGKYFMAQPKVDGAVPKKVLEGKLDEIFTKCDSDGDGKISKIELVKACKSDQSLAGFFGLTQTIRAENGINDQMEKIFQEIDKDDSKTITREELFKFFTGAAPSSKRGADASPAEEPEAKRPVAEPKRGPGGRASAAGYTGGAGTEVKPPESYLPASADPSSYQVSGGTGYTGGAGTEVKPPEAYQMASADPSSYQVSGGTGYTGGAGTEVKPPESYQPASADPSSYQVAGGTGYTGAAGTEVKDPTSYQVSGGAGGGYAAPPTAAYTAAPDQA